MLLWAMYETTVEQLQFMNPNWKAVNFMKNARILQVVVACVGLVALQAHASDPYHSDFSSSVV